MKSTLFLLALSFLASCSSANFTKEKLRLAERIQAEEVRSLQEIKSHTEILLDEHPELKEITKNELKAALNTSLARHQELKERESKIFQLLLEKSLKASQLTAEEQQDKNNLKKTLNDVYEQKSDNVHWLVGKMVELSNNNQISESFKDDLLIFMRDFR